MTGEEFKAARLQLGLTQAQMAEVVGLGADTRVSEIEHGRGGVTRTMEILVELLVELHLAYAD
jgi:transcriptional regulator with XRE-family HTH domain